MAIGKGAGTLKDTVDTVKWENEKEDEETGEESLETSGEKTIDWRLSVCKSPDPMYMREGVY